MEGGTRRDRGAGGTGAGGAGAEEWAGQLEVAVCALMLTNSLVSLPLSYTPSGTHPPPPPPPPPPTPTPMPTRTRTPMPTPAPTPTPMLMPMLMATPTPTPLPLPLPLQVGFPAELADRLVLRAELAELRLPHELAELGRCTVCTRMRTHTHTHTYTHTHTL